MIAYCKKKKTTKLEHNLFITTTKTCDLEIRATKETSVTPNVIPDFNKKPRNRWSFEHSFQLGANYPLVYIVYCV